MDHSYSYHTQCERFDKLMRYKPNNYRKKQRVKDSFVNHTTHETKQRKYLKHLEEQRKRLFKLECPECSRKSAVDISEYHNKIACPSCMSKSKVRFYEPA